MLSGNEQTQENKAGPHVSILLLETTVCVPRWGYWMNTYFTDSTDMSRPLFWGRAAPSIHLLMGASQDKQLEIDLVLCHEWYSKNVFQIGHWHQRSPTQVKPAMVTSKHYVICCNGPKEPVAYDQIPKHELLVELCSRCVFKSLTLGWWDGSMGNGICFQAWGPGFDP